MASVSGKLVPASVCVECGWPLAGSPTGGEGVLREGVLCRRCATRHREGTRHEELLREALAWAFVTLVFLALVGWGVAHLVASGALALR